MARLALFLFLTLTILLVRLPAGLMDHVADRASAGKLRLTSVEGTFWAGRAMLAIPDGRRGLKASRAIEWRFALDPARGGLNLALSEHGQVQARLSLRPDGARLDQLNLELPLELITAAIAHPAAKAGWQGRLDLQSNELFCSWSGACDGRARIEWRDAGLDIVPERHLGDHEILLHAVGSVVAVKVRTLDAAISIAADGTLERNGHFSMSGAIEGDPDLVDRLPNIMDRNARLSGKSGRTLISFP